MKTKIFRSERIKYFISYLNMLMIPLLIFIVFIFTFFLNVYKENALKTYELSIEKAVQDVDYEFEALKTFSFQLSQEMWIKKLINLQGGVADEGRINSYELNQYNNQLTTYELSNTTIDKIMLLLINKNLILSSFGKYEADDFFENVFNLVDEDIYDSKSSKLKYESGIIAPANVRIYNENSKGLIFIERYPVLTVDKQKASLLIYINMDIFKNSFSAINEIENSKIFVLNHKGNIVYSNIDDNINEKYNKELDKDKKMFLYEFHLDNTNFTYKIFIPNTVISSNIQSIMITIYICIALYILFGILISYLYYKRSYRPLNDLLSYISIKAEELFPEKSINEYEWLQKEIEIILDKSNKLLSRVERNKPVLVESYIQKLIFGNDEDNEQYLGALNLLGVNFKYIYYTCIVISSKDKVNTKMISRRIKDIEIEGLLFERIIKDLDIVVMLNFSDEKKVAKICDEIGDIDNIVVGIGSYSENINDTKKSYEEAKIATEYMLFSEYSKVIYYSDIKDNDQIYYFPMDKEVKFINFLKAGDDHSANLIFKELIKHNKEKKRITPKAFIEFFSLIETIGYKAIEDKNCTRKSESKEFILKEFDFNSMIKNTLVFIEEICEINRNRVLDNPKMQINKILKFVDENIDDDLLSLTTISSEMNMNISTLSNFFKEHTNTNLKKYISEKRITKSKSLLKETDMSILDIAFKVGYTNDITFRRAFKKIEGITPGKYRKLYKDIK